MILPAIPGIQATMLTNESIINSLITLQRTKSRKLIQPIFVVLKLPITTRKLA
jgi:hypothetical protein